LRIEPRAGIDGTDGGTIVRHNILSAIIWIAASVAIALGGFPSGSALAYPNGPLHDVTDAATYCAGCHSSVGVEQLRDLPAEDARTRTAAVAHLEAIKAGSDNYAKLTPAQRASLIADVEKVDANARVSIEVPGTVKPGQKFAATVNSLGGSGPVTGIMLLDIDMRDQAREIQGEGFMIDGPPRVIGPDGKAQDQWVSRRFDALARNLNFIVVFGVKADLAANKFSTSSVIWDLVAPPIPGKYTICAAFLYGTEKASPLGRVEMKGRAMPLGGFDGSSGRILFSKVATIDVH
jgi:cytochrome c553